MEARRRLRPARKDEALQRLERLVRLVAVALERVDLRLRHAQLPVVRLVRDRQVGAEVEELVLDALEPRVASLDLRPAEDAS